VAALPETLRIVQAVHDTVPVVMRGTVVRVPEPQATDRWIAIVSGLATIIAAAFMMTIELKGRELRK
jgi:hypothetical protein